MDCYICLIWIEKPFGKYFWIFTSLYGELAGDQRFLGPLWNSWRARIPMTDQNRLCLMNWRHWMNTLRHMYACLHLKNTLVRVVSFALFLLWKFTLISWRMKSGAIYCWGEDNCCWFEFGTKAVPSRRGSWSLQELDCPRKLNSFPQVQEGMQLLFTLLTGCSFVLVFYLCLI